GVLRRTDRGAVLGCRRCRWLRRSRAHRPGRYQAGRLRRAARPPGRNAMPSYTLLTVDGEDLGTVSLGRPDWPEGSILYRGNGPNLRVVRLVEGDDGHQTCWSSRRSSVASRGNSLGGRGLSKPAWP